MKYGGYTFPRALPRVEVTPDQAMDIIQRHAGMTLRDYFAGQALAGVLSAHAILASAALAEEVTRECIAEECYRQADAMLAERAK